MTIHGQSITRSIYDGKHKPLPIQRVEIPKSNGKKRQLDIPTVVSRIIQQAIAQVLVSLYESQFSSSSYGFHPHRNAHETIRSWHLNRHSNLTLQHLAADINPIVRDWIINYEKKVILKNTIIEGLIQYLATMHPVYE